MVMNYEIIDTYLHMSNHYKLINSAKSVVNTSPPKCFLKKKNKKQSTTPTTRYSTPSLLRLPSRTNSHYEFNRRLIKPHNCLQNAAPRSSSAPSQKYIKSTVKVSRESSNCSKPEIKHVTTSKTPIPTPRKKLPSSNKSMIPNYEYLQFSLRITEDIIRNDLYDPEEMQRVFNSHLEANRGRLDKTKMIQQIDHLCKELSITTNVNIAKKPSELTLSQNSKLLLDKIANKQYNISTEEIRNFSQNDLQNIITGILDYEIENKESEETKFQSSENFVNLTTQDIETELKEKQPPDTSAKYHEQCTDLIPMNLSQIPQKIETSVKIINLEVNQLHDDLIEINKNLTEGFLNLKETIVEKPDETPEVSIKKNEITQTPFSIEIAQFFDKLPESETPPPKLKEKHKIVLEKSVKDVLHVVGKSDVENLTEKYEQINIYEPIRYFEVESKRETPNNFISNVSNLILDGINDLFEPIPRKITEDYFKYEMKTDEDKYIKDKYKLTSTQKSSDVSLSEGEIIAQKSKKSNSNILKVLEQYEYKTWDHNNINKYQINKFDLFRSNTSSPSSRLLMRRESLLSDGEIKYCSDSDECKTDFSNFSSNK